MKDTKSLKENHEFRRIYYRGSSFAEKYLVLYCRKNKLGYNRLGLTVSAKIGNAVIRNRIKRLIKESYRLNEKRFTKGVDLVIVARNRAVYANFHQIESSLLQALEKLPVAAAKL